MTIEARTPQQIQAQWSAQLVADFNRRWQEFWAWCDRENVPLPLREAALRDVLSAIEHLRLAQNLTQYIPSLRGGNR